MMAYLSADRHPQVLLSLLEHPNLPQELVKELALHKKSSVRQAAARRLDAPRETSVGGTADEHIPQLRDRAFTQPDATVVSIATGVPLRLFSPDGPAGTGVKPDAPRRGKC